mmetsp:Transcript_14997/g.49181  ORF Transcript_14997/g.49181 Transcript_14997/m.49181 type:complete len:707 (+) Transcript_14997:35-2155(+)
MCTHAETEDVIAGLDTLPQVLQQRVAHELVVLCSSPSRGEERDERWWADDAARAARCSQALLALEATSRSLRAAVQAAEVAWAAVDGRQRALEQWRLGHQPRGTWREELWARCPRRLQRNSAEAHYARDVRHRGLMSLVETVDAASVAAIECDGDALVAFDARAAVAGAAHAVVAGGSAVAVALALAQRSTHLRSLCIAGGMEPSTLAMPPPLSQSTERLVSTLEACTIEDWPHLTDGVFHSFCRRLPRSSLTDLSLAGLTSLTDSGLASAVQGFPNLERVNLARTAAGAGALGSLPLAKLRELSLAQCPQMAHGVELSQAFRFATRLASLDLCELRFVSAEAAARTLAAVASHCPRLQRLNLRETACVRTRALVPLSRLANLSDLNVRGCRSLEEPLPTMPALRRLKIGWGYVRRTAADRPTFAAGALLTSLTLSVGCTLSEWGVRAIGEECPNLERFRLLLCVAASEEALCEGVLMQCTKLKRVTIKGCGAGGGGGGFGALLMRSLGTLRRLSRLTLSGPAFHTLPSASLLEFLEAVKYTGARLEKIDFGDMRLLTPTALRALARTCGPTLTRLSLCDCRSLVQMEESLEHCQNLMSLTVAHCGRLEPGFVDSAERLCPRLVHLTLDACDLDRGGFAWTPIERGGAALRKVTLMRCKRVRRPALAGGGADEADLSAGGGWGPCVRTPKPLAVSAFDASVPRPLS